MKITSAKEIRKDIFGDNAVEVKKVKTGFGAMNYAYKTKGGRYYLFITGEGERRRISKEEYESYE